MDPRPITIRAKFYLEQKTEYASEYVGLVFRAVYSDDPNHENKMFWDYTPTAELAMQVKKDAADFFEVGGEYYVDFERAPVAVAE